MIYICLCVSYLRARQFDISKSSKLLVESLTWRLAYKPASITAKEVEPECATGKIRVLPELDRHNRPILVLDSSRENSKNHDSQLRHLVWQLERAKSKMNQHQGGGPKSTPVEKYCLSETNNEEINNRKGPLAHATAWHC